VFAFFVAIHVLISVALIFVVLLQSGRGGGLAGVFGGGQAQTFFGGRGAATFLSKATAWLAVSFMVMSILLAVVSSRGGSSSEGILQRRARERASQAVLPPSTTSFDPMTALDSLDVEGEPATGLEAPAEAPPDSN
jgi:preprotein translocase subunit SecG